MHAALLMIALFVSSPEMFTIHADVEGSVTLRATCSSVRAYLNNRDIFTRHFPGTISIRQIDKTQSEWTYEVKPPLSSSRRTSYIVNERYADGNTVIFETTPGADDYMYCMARVAAASDTTTTFTLVLKLQSSRQHGSDIHFLAPLVGQNFISARMRDQLNNDMTTFFTRISDDLDTRTAISH